VTSNNQPSMILSLPFAQNIFFAQAEYSTSTQGNPPSPLFWIVWAALVIFMIATMWKLFTKAGQPGWASIIPIVNTYFMIKVAGRPGWWLLLLFIPLVNFVILIILFLDIAKRFGKGVGFGIGLILLPIIFFPILAFGNAQYQAAPAPATP
jgi:Family of unknown function (DUF5684)